MASGDPKNELNCSICLSLYTDPVSLKCGHNFCRFCIVQVLDTQDGSGGYSCPDCRVEYPERPPIEKRRKLGNIVEGIRIFCSNCIKSPVPAVKSCLHCEISLCDDHLTVHNKTMDHILAEPTSSFGKKKCPIHKKVLEYYCAQDEACLCVSCCLVGEHRGHQVELLDKASEEKKKQQRKNLEELRSQKAEIQTRVQNMQDHKSIVQEKASDKRKKINELFWGIKEQLERAEEKVLNEISRQEKKKVSQISHLIMKLEKEEDELSRKMCHLEEMCHVTDPIRILQEGDITVCGHGDGEDKGGDGGKIKSEDNSNVQVFDSKVRENRTDQNMVLQQSGQGVAYGNKSMAAEEIAPVNEFHNIDDEMADDLDDLADDLDDTADDLDETAYDLDEVLISLTIHQAMWDILPNVTSQLGFQVPGILLDVDTADEYIEVSEDLKTARDVERQIKPKSLLRFMDYTQVLSIHGLSSGRHFWEVQWNQIGRCDFGMSYPSIKRKGDNSGIGTNDKSWGIVVEDYELFLVIHNNNSETLDIEPTCSTFGVFLDYEAGRLSFYEMCDPIRHLHTFSASFTEPLHALICVYDEASVAILS